MFRTLTARALAPILAATGYRFSKSFRRGDTLGHRIVYRLVDTVGANLRASDIRETPQEAAYWQEMEIRIREGRI